MRKILLIGLAGVSLLALVAFGWLRHISRDARRWDTAQVTVAYRSPAECSVALRGSVDKHGMLCSDVADYFRDHLKLSAGTKYLIYDVGDSDKTGVKDLRLKLNQKGYIGVGVVAAVIQEPER
jgi:hypothetical protein